MHSFAASTLYCGIRMHTLPVKKKLFLFNMLPVTQTVSVNEWGYFRAVTANTLFAVESICQLLGGAGRSKTTTLVVCAVLAG